ncbi:hypothetical protein RMATCC62417_06465 [Rhizopus microsporus]|nr:hypothetical protein RMATCC62417_06465 [Rhizopus microsporus]
MVPTTPTHVGSPIVQNRRLCSEAQQEITSLLEFTARSRSSSGGCIQPDMAKEGSVFESTLETNFQSTKEDSRGQSQTSYFNSPIVANSMLVETDTTNEALEGTDIDKAQPSMATSRMDVIFRKRITEGLTIQEVECLSQATRSKTQKAYDHGWRVWSNWYEKYDLDPQAYDPQMVFRFLNARAHLSAPTLNVYRSSIASVFNIIHQGKTPIAEDSLIVSFFQAKRKSEMLIPDQDKQQVWDVQQVITCIRS